MSITQGFEEFVAIAEAGSVSGAARSLGVPRATLSRQLARLERELGVQLAHRTSRTLSLTRAGQLLYERARRILENAREAHEDVARLDDVPRGILRVSVPAGPQAWFTAMVGAFLDANPEVSVEVLATSRFVDLVAEQVDVVVRAGTADHGELIGRVLQTTRVVCVASPAYLRRKGVPREPADLAHHDCIRFIGGGRSDAWPTADGGKAEISGRFATNDMWMCWQAALQGRGIAMVPEAFAAPAEARGEIKRVLDGIVGVAGRVWVLYADRRFLAPKIRAFIDHIFVWTEANGSMETRFED